MRITRKPTAHSESLYLADLFCIAPERIDEYWVAVRPFIETAMETSAYDEPANVYEALKEERAQLWIVCHEDGICAVCVTRLTLDTKVKTCGIWVMTGEGREEWQHLIKEIEEFAMREGCTLMRHSARPGWSRPMKAHGYKMTHVILEKAI